MDRALAKLIFLRFRGGLRRRLRRLGTASGLIRSIAGFGFVGICLVYLVWRAPSAEHAVWAPDAVKPATVEMMPVMLLAMCLVTLATTSGPTIYFNPAEVNFLLAGPFHRRSLLLYKFAIYAVGALISALFVAVCLPHYAGGWASALAGTFLTLAFIQLFSAGVGLLGQTVAARTFFRMRWTMIVVVGLVAAVAWRVRVGEAEASDLASSFHAWRSSVAGQVLLAPFHVFSKTLMAESGRDLLRWGSLAAGINLVLLGVTLWLDAEYIEAVETSSRRLHERWQRMRRGRAVAHSEAMVGLRIPRLPRFGGVGPIAGRQLTTAVRTSYRSLAFLLIGSALSGPLLVAAAEDGVPTATLVGMVMVASVVLAPRMLTFDLRGDVDHFDQLRSLPLSPIIVTLGELTAPVLLASTAHLLLLATTILTAPSSVRPFLLALIPSIPAVNLLHYGLENLIFLLFPSRVLPVGRVDFEFFGRMFLETGFKLFWLTICLAVAGVLAVIVYVATGQGLILASAVAGFWLLIVAALTTLVAARAFRQFDMSRSLPE